MTGDKYFGQAVHIAMKNYINGSNAIAAFDNMWGHFKEAQLQEGWTWERYSKLGRKFILDAENILKTRQYKAMLVEARITLPSGELIQPDFLGNDLHGNYVVLDYKVTDLPLRFDEAIYGQLVNGKEFLKTWFPIKEERIMGIICNFVKETGHVRWLEEDITNFNKIQKNVFHSINLGG